MADTPYRISQDKIGKRTNGNPITLPNGSAQVLKNFELTRPNAYKKVRGRNAYGSNLPDENIRQFLEYRNRLLVHMNGNK